MEKPTWILLPFIPDYRWGISSENTPWYNSVRLFRQAEGRLCQPAGSFNASNQEKEISNWDGVITRVVNDLNKQILSYH